MFEMLKDEDGQFFIIGKIIHGIPVTITIPYQSKKYFPNGSRVKVTTMDKKEEFTKRVREDNKGRQRVVTVPKEEWDFFKPKMSVRIYPQSQEFVLGIVENKEEN